MIPVFEPSIGESESRLINDAIQRGEISGSFGQYIPMFESEFAAYCGVKHGIAVTSGTTALHVAVQAIGLQPGDEVLVSASTNIATALAVHHNGGVPVPVDSEEKTWNLDLDLLESLITPRTRAIIPVHLFGHPVDMDALMAIANRHSLIVIEDAAEAHGATVRGRMVGGFGHMSCFSFYANKIITTGEGGMVLTNDYESAERLRLLRNLAFTTPRFRHDVAGHNFRMTGLQAAMGVAQVRRIDEILRQKIQLATEYSERLSGLEQLSLPRQEDWAKHVYWMYGIRVRGKISRDELAAKLRNHGIDTRTFFCPMNIQPCFSMHERCKASSCPVAESMWTDGLYLPSTGGLAIDQVDYICDTIKTVLAA